MSKLNKGLLVIFAAAAIGAVGTGIYYAEQQAVQTLKPLTPPAAACVGQCAEVNAALTALRNAGTDKDKQQAAIQKLSTALPVYGAPAMKEAQKKLDAYKAAHNGKAPSSVLDVYSANIPSVRK